MEERNFKGIWIPKEIWLANELSLQEKVVLVEIDSLDDENKGCYASNKYFADFFNLSCGRVSQIIKELHRKGYLNISYNYQGKEITERVIKINKPPYPKVFNLLNTCLENDMGGIKKTKGGYLENCKENNISINNTNNNKEIYKEILEEFEELWKLYPKKNGKKKSFDYYVRAKRNGVTFDTIKLGIEKYVDYIEQSKTPFKYIKDGSTWFNQECWNDERKVEQNGEVLPDWFGKEIEEKEMTEEEKEEMQRDIDNLKKNF